MVKSCPFYDAVFATGATVQWTDKRQVAASVAEGLTTSRRDRFEASADPKEAILAMLNSRERGQFLREIGAVLQWTTISDDQLGQITGTSVGQAGRMSHALAGQLLSRGTYISDIHRRPQSQRRHLYRPSDATKLPEWFLGQLTFSEYLGVTQGKPFVAGSMADRHNILSLELALRAGRLDDIIGVVPASLCGHSMLAADQVTAETRRADAGVIRFNGLRIAVETTSYALDDFVKKVEVWAELLARNPGNGLVVVFVEVAQPRRSHGPDSTWRAMAKALKDVAARRRSAATRMFLVRWIDWFPARGVAEPAFETLRCQRAGGEIAYLLDPTDAEMDEPSASGALADNLNESSFAVPHWLRSERRDWTPALLRQAGQESLLIPPPVGSLWTPPIMVPSWIPRPSNDYE